MRAQFVAFVIVLLAVVGMMALTRAFDSKAYAVDFERRIVEVAPGQSIQGAIDYAASQGAYQRITGGSTEQGGQPWLVMLLPGEYRQSNLAMRSGVNLSSYGERTVLIFSESATTPALRCGANVTISGITIEHWHPANPAVTVEHGASQCSFHRAIISGRTESIRISGGFARIFDSDIRNGKVVLEPTVNYPTANPVAFNCVRCRLWHDDFVVRGSKNALYLFQDSSFGSSSDDSVGIISTATGHVDGRVLNSTTMRRLQVSGTYKTLVRAADIDTLAVLPGATAEVFGSFIGNIEQAGGSVVLHPNAGG